MFCTDKINYSINYSINIIGVLHFEMGHENGSQEKSDWSKDNIHDIHIY